MFGVQDYLARSWHEICWIGPSAWLRSRVNVGPRYKSEGSGKASLSESTSV
jgi:hypothetical protein